MSGRAYSYKSTPTGQEFLLSKTEQVIEVESHQTAVTVDLKCYFCQEFNQFVEEEKTRRDEAIQKVRKLQERLETIQADLSSTQKDEKQLQEVVSFPPSLISSTSFIPFIPLRPLS